MEDGTGDGIIVTGEFESGVLVVAAPSRRAVTGLFIFTGRIDSSSQKISKVKRSSACRRASRVIVEITSSSTLRNLTAAICYAPQETGGTFG
jgi:hypothetical protein